MTFSQTGLELGNFLTWLARRQEVIASNIANADTPGYHTQDLAQQSSFLTVLSETSPELLEAPGLPYRNDGNNVSMDREARLLAENTLRFNVAAQMLRGEIKDIHSAIQEGRSA